MSPMQIKNELSKKDLLLNFNTLLCGTSLALYGLAVA